VVYKDIRDFFTLSWYNVLIDENNIITSVKNIDVNIANDPKILIHRFFYTYYDGYMWTHYGWVTQYLEIVNFKKELFEKYSNQKTINRELLIELDDKYSIENYIKMLEL